MNTQENTVYDGPQRQREDYGALRRWMVEIQLESQGIGDRRVLAAMATVPREEFVPDQFRVAAYEDCPLPIGFDQTISQPFTVAYMAQALRLTGGEMVLEIGTGSGYAAAILSGLAREVHTIERIGILGEEARLRLTRLGYDNVYVHVGDGTLGLPQEAPFDAIIVTAGAPTLPQIYADQLAEGGRIVIPLGSSTIDQTMCRLTRRGDHMQRENLGSFAFVPLVGKHGWNS